MAPVKGYKRAKAISPTLLREYEVDLAAFAQCAKAGVRVKPTRDAIDCLVEFCREMIGEIRRLKGRITVINSDAEMLRDLYRKERRKVRGIDLQIKGASKHDH